MIYRIFDFSLLTRANEKRKDRVRIVMVGSVGFAFSDGVDERMGEETRQKEK